jgi:hypothetical protein
MNYLPKQDQELLHWLKNFSDQLPQVGISIGVTPAEIASLNALIFDIKTDIRQGRLNESDFQLKKQKMLNFLKGLIVKMTNHHTYSKMEHGKKLGIE